MTAIKEMQKEIQRIQSAIAEYTNEWGYPKPGYKYRVKVLAEQANSFRESIKWLEAMKGA